MTCSWPRRIFTPPADTDVSGGAGGASSSGGGSGGAGADGLVRIDGPTGVSGAWQGPAVAVGDVNSLTNTAALTLHGTAQPGATVDVAAIGGGPLGETTAATDGTWSVDVTLAPGLDRLAVTETDTDSVTAQSWTGTSLDLEKHDPAMPPLPVGASVDVVYLPPG